MDNRLNSLYIAGFPLARSWFEFEHAHVALVTLPLMDCVIAALSVCVGRYIIYAYICTCGPLSYQTCLAIYLLRLAQDDVASH